jgi:integrase
MAAKQRKLTRKAERPRGQIIFKGNGKWLVRVFAGHAIGGRKRYVSRQIKGTFTQAKQARTKLLTEIDEGAYIPPAKQTLEAFLTNWLDTIKRPVIAVGTLAEYRGQLKRRVYPTLGQRRLDQIHRQDIQTLYHHLETVENVGGRTIHEVHMILNQAFSFAVKSEVLRTNPAQYAEPPSRKRATHEVLTPDEVNVLLKGAQSDSLYALWCLLTLGGLRPQEAFALKWSDVAGDTVRIRQAMKRGEKGRYVVGDTKTQSSRRPVQLHSVAVEALRLHKLRQAEQILAAGKKYKRQDFIFTGKTGEPLDISKARKRFHSLLEKCKLPKVRLYDLRHTHATMLMATNTNPKLVQARLGHSSIAITLDLYSHVLPGMGQIAVDNLNQLVAPVAVGQ